MDFKSLRRGVRLMIGVSALCLASGAGAQENLDQGKNPAQLFASDCAVCHKSPQGLSKSGGAELDSFLREHYTASREAAFALANYLRSMDAGPRRASRRPAKDDKTKSIDNKKAEVKPANVEGAEKTNAATDTKRSSQPKSAEPRSSRPKPSDRLRPVFDE